MSPLDIPANQTKSWMNGKRYLSCSQIVSRRMGLSCTETRVQLLSSQETTTRRLQS